MQTQNESPPDNKHTNPLSQLAQSMFSNNNNNNNNNNINNSINNSTIMLAAIVSLLLVILFVLLLHIYAKWFLSQSHQSQLQHRRRRRRDRRRVSGAMGPSQLNHFHIEDSPFSTKGLDSATVSAIPMFVYEAGEAEATGETGEAGEAEETEELECVICLSGFEEGEIGRSLPKCGHAFHVECIDMWLSSHCNCPICRAPIVCGGGVVQNDSLLGYVDGDDDGGGGGGDGDGDHDHDGDDDDHGVLEIVIGTPSYEISESENENVGGGGVVSGGSVSETSSSLLGCSLKRMMSKVFVSSNLNELDGS